MTCINKRFGNIATSIQEIGVAENLNPYNNGIDFIMSRKKDMPIRMDSVYPIEKLKYIKSGTTGTVFCHRKDDNQVGIKCIFTRKRELELYSKSDKMMPIDAEYVILTKLASLVKHKMTPHICLPIFYFETMLDDVEEAMRADKKKYAEFLADKSTYDRRVNVIVSEWQNRGDFLGFIRSYGNVFSERDWKIFSFQILITLALIQQEFPGFRHNDLKPNNVLISYNDSNSEYFNYKFRNTHFRVPNNSYTLKMWDFDFSNIPDIANNAKVHSNWANRLNIRPSKNDYYDMHYFFSSLVNNAFGVNLAKYSNAQEIAPFLNFISRIVPPKFLQTMEANGKTIYRLTDNVEFTTPAEVILRDEYFSEFRK